MPTPRDSADPLASCGPKRIICIGNRYVDADAAGARVFDRLATWPLGDDVELVDGGVGGLLLLDRVESASAVVFVDAVKGFGQEGQVLQIAAAEAAANVMGPFDHTAGLAWLLRALPLASDRPPPPITVVGIEGRADAAAIERAAALACSLVGCAAANPAGGAA